MGSRLRGFGYKRDSDDVLPKATEPDMARFISPVRAASSVKVNNIFACVIVLSISIIGYMISISFS